MRLTERGYRVVAWLAAFVLLSFVGLAGWVENLGV